MVKINRWGVCLLLILCCWLHAEQSMAVLKEKDINATLTILRQELMNKHDELEKRSKISASRNERIMKQFRETYHLSNQNSLMLYSQRPEYVFDLTYACHEATKQFQEFTRHSLPPEAVHREERCRDCPLRQSDWQSGEDDALCADG